MRLPESRLLLLHLSDLHFGPHSRFARQDLTQLGMQFHQAIEEARKEHGLRERVALVALTGDIAEAAQPREYQDAQAFFESLVAEMGLDRRRFIFVSGNHDVSWHECRKIEQDQDAEGFDSAELARRIQERKLVRFEAFLAAFYGQNERPGAFPLGRGAFVHELPELALSVAALNSCEAETHQRQGGLIGSEQAQALMLHWNRPEARNLLKVT